MPITNIFLSACCCKSGKPPALLYSDAIKWIPTMAFQLVSVNFFEIKPHFMLMQQITWNVEYGYTTKFKKEHL